MVPALARTLLFIAPAFLGACVHTGGSGMAAGDDPATSSSALPEVRERMVAAKGAQLFVQESGEGPPVILVHGSAGSSDLWEEQLGSFARAGFRAIAFDLRNRGRSRAEPGFETAESIASDIEQLRLGLGLGSITIVGQAQGAEGTLEYAIVHPETTRAIVVASSYRGAFAEPAFVSLRDALAHPAQLAQRTGIQMRLSQAYISSNPEGAKRFEQIADAATNGTAASAPIDGRRLAESVQPPGIPLDYSALGRITAPALVLSAARDDVTPPQLMEELARQIPGAVYTTVPDAGRYAFWENPQAFDRIVLEFLRRQFHP